MKKVVSVLLFFTMILFLVSCTSEPKTTVSEPAAAEEATAKTADEKTVEKEVEKVALKAADLKPDNYPTKPITILVGSTAGGGTDIMARALAEAMEIDTPVNIVNRPGASGTIAAAECAVAKPDGYTIIAGMPAPWYIQPHLNDLTYTMDDFRNISVISPDEQLVICVTPDSEIQSFKDLEKIMKEGGDIDFGTSNPGSVGHCGLSDLFMQMGVYDKFEMVPFAGAAPAITALLGGHINVTTADLAEAAPRVLNGQLKALAVFGDERCGSLPDVPCLKELGYVGTDYVIAFKWISVPKDTPEEIVTYLKAVVDEAVMSESYGAFIKQQNGLDTYTLTEEEMTAKLKSCYDSYNDILMKIGLHKNAKK